MPKSPLSIGLVIVQFSIIAFYIAYVDTPTTTLSRVLFISALLIGLWAIATMRFAVNVFPDVRKGQQLYTNGIYRYIRHPMYTAILLLCLSFLVRQVDVITLLAWGCLLGVLLRKLTYEEQLLNKRFTAYQAYTKRSKRLVPFIW
jgi:protein-S-isoprenylcysteine O-methyltransferase Ste14